VSRSIHANRSWRTFEQRGFYDWAAIEAKRRVKRAVVEAKAVQRVPSSQSGFSIPDILVGHVEPYLFFPASRDDFHAVLRALPVGVADGIRSIRLESGVDYVNQHGSSSAHQDPLIGRRGDEIYAGIYAPTIRGTYDPVTNDVRVFGFVRAPGAAMLPWQFQELRFSMLRTLVHEVAHHFDRTSREARGRWLMDDFEKGEQYADATAIRWCREVVVPYLVERYGQPSKDAV
jgi:hypothetical protein